MPSQANEIETANSKPSDDALRFGTELDHTFLERPSDWWMESRLLKPPRPLPVTEGDGTFFGFDL